MKLSKDQLSDMLIKMLQIRHFEKRVKELFMTHEIPGATHLYLGEEAVAVGACDAIRENDYIISTHRGHGHCIAKGGKLDKMMAELFGKETGYCKGKGGSMHIADMDIGILGANGIVGGGIPIATGAGFSIKIRKTNQVTLCFFGDGASNQGSFHEGINMAAVLKLPVIFICENNQFAVSTPVSFSVPIKNVADRASSYGISGVTIDGNDVLKVFETVSEAVKRAREGKGPSLVECKTYRWEGHSISDPGIYRDTKEVEEWKKNNDPIERFKKKLIEENSLRKEEVEKIEQDVIKSIKEAEKFARESSYPSIEKIKEDLYA